MAKCDVCGGMLIEGMAHRCRGAQKPRGCPKCKLTTGHAVDCPTLAPVATTGPVVATVNDPITNIYKQNAKTIKPMLRIVPEYQQLVRGLNNTSSYGTHKSCSDDTVKRLVTALCFTEKEDLLRTTVANTWKIGQFMSLSEAFQIQVINRIWDECAPASAYDCATADMVETDGDVTPNDHPLPSSLRPNPGAGLPFVKGPTRLPWKTLGIGFRVDGMASDTGEIGSIARILKEGITAQVLNPPFIQGFRGMMVTQTAVALNTSAPRIYHRAKDLFNETAVCVARSFLGATAFPERDTDGEVALWAVDTTGLTGYDTEKFQIAKAAQWRPGEKCFEKIPVSQVLGYVRIRKFGVGTKNGWSFQVPKDAEWVPVSYPKSGPKQRYIQDELAAWANGIRYDISTDYDFKPTGG